MNAAFGRDALLDAFDWIGRAAVQAGTKLQIAVYGGSALMLASNFRFATEDVDVSKLERPLPNWLAKIVDEIARKNHWRDDWFNDGVAFHLSQLAENAVDVGVAVCCAGSQRDVVHADFVATFEWAKTDPDRYASIEREPRLAGDEQLDARVGAIGEWVAKQRRLGSVPSWAGDPARRL